uniref:Lipoprotein n=1 Tax=Streptomyces sp. ML694-90F3 TaxID=1265536 RepID=A0A077KT69_9ACTN|nr:hypothetical protein [Streptomyces sp. ML694-90F3]
MKTTRRITAILLAGAALTACSGDSDKEKRHNDVPMSWIRSTYTANTSGYLDRVDAPPAVASEIHTNTPARDQFTDTAGKVYLRYDDDIVAVSKHPQGTLIEVDDYRTGYQRHYTHLRSSAWPDPAYQEFRGGGPGSGK